MRSRNRQERILTEQVGSRPMRDPEQQVVLSSFMRSTRSQSSQSWQFVIERYPYRMRVTKGFVAGQKKARQIDQIIDLNY